VADTLNFYAAEYYAAA